MFDFGLGNIQICIFLQECLCLFSLEEFLKNSEEFLHCQRPNEIVLPCHDSPG